MTDVHPAIPGDPTQPLPPAGTTAQLLADVRAAIAENGPRAAADPWRQGFHIQPPTGLLNDPNGLVWHHGTYHVFYQWHPFQPAHKLKFWAHLTSPDLVNWTEQPVALIPDQPYDAQGCYSGSAVVHEDRIHLFYTGNVRTADGARLPHQCLAVIDADGGITKSPHNPLVTPLPQFTGHLRDPKILTRDGQYLMLLGAQTHDLCGALALLRSTDLLTWHVVGEIAGGAAEAEGYMWECPDLVSLDGRDVLLVCPQYDHGPQAGAGQFHDAARYCFGTLDLAAGRFEHGPFADLDFGPDFYAPQTFVDGDRRTILIGWLGMPDHPGQPDLAAKHPTVAHGWVHCLSVPRVLSLRGDTLMQWPVAELEQLRVNSVHYPQALIPVGETVALADVSGVRFDLSFRLNLSHEGSLKLAVRAQGDQATVLQLRRGAAVLDTSAAGVGIGGVFQAELPEQSEDINVRVLVDNSSIEVFLDGGSVVFSARIYPAAQATGVSWSATGTDVEVNDLDCHQIS